MKLLITLCVLSFSMMAHAVDDPHKADREQLRAIFSDMEKALNQRDFIQAAKELIDINNSNETGYEIEFNSDYSKIRKREV